MQLAMIVLTTPLNQLRGPPVRVANLTVKLRACIICEVLGNAKVC